MRLISELRRRQMFRLTGLYIVGAWLVLQVADIAFPSWGIPDSAMRYLFYAAFLCYPIAFIFGWFFDLRKDGIYRTRKAGPDEIADTTMRWQDYAVLAALAGIGIVILLGSADRIRTETETTAPETIATVERHENSVAVLPFENLDPNPETGFFSDGVTDEILGELGNIRELFVPARRSSFAFRNTNESATSISAKLGVLYLLDGTIRRDGDLVRVTARLVDKDGVQVWSESFDRKLEKIFAIQSEIANAVALRVASEIVRPVERPAARRTENSDAYNDYLLGKQLFHDRPLHWPEKAEALFRSAIALDPEFALPYAYLGTTLALISDESEFTDEALDAANAALRLDPDLAAAHLALGLIHRRRNETDASMAAYRRAIELDPTLPEAYNLLANILGGQGLLREAHELRLQAFEHDPLNPALINNIAYRLAQYGEFERAEKLILRMTQLPVTPDFMYFRLTQFYWLLGKLDRSLHWSKAGARDLISKYNESLYPHIINQLGDLGFFYQNLQLESQAEFWMTLAAEEHPDEAQRLYWRLARCELRSDLSCNAEYLRQIETLLSAGTLESNRDLLIFVSPSYILLDDFDKAIELLAPLFDMDNLDEVQWYRLIDPAHLLAFAYLETRQDDEAEKLLSAARKPLEYMVMSDGVRDAETYAQLALNRWLQQDEEGAVENFRNALDAGWIILEETRVRPEWQEFLALPELQDDLLEVESEIARQRTIVEAADATDDFSDVVDAFLAKFDEQT